MSDYCTRDDIEDLFGVENVKKWADLDGDGNAVSIAARIARAIVVASAHIDDRLRGGPYVLPVAGSPATLVDLAAALAGIWLYEARGVEDYDEATGEIRDKVNARRKRAEKTLRDIRSGAIRLDATLANTGTTAPIVVND